MVSGLKCDLYTEHFEDHWRCKWCILAHFLSQSSMFSNLQSYRCRLPGWTGTRNYSGFSNIFWFRIYRFFNKQHFPPSLDVFCQIERWGTSHLVYWRLNPFDKPIKKKQQIPIGLPETTSLANENGWDQKMILSFLEPYDLLPSVVVVSFGECCTVQPSCTRDWL